MEMKIVSFFPLKKKFLLKPYKKEQEIITKKFFGVMFSSFKFGKLFQNFFITLIV